MRIYNLKGKNNKERFYYSILYSTLTALSCAILISLITDILNIKFSILYLVSAYLISSAIHKAGGGFGIKYSYMGAIVTTLSIVFAELFTHFGIQILIHPQLWLTGIRSLVEIYTISSFRAVLPIFFMVWSIYIGYTNSNIENL